VHAVGRFLGRMGEVRTVASATDALAALEQEPADVVVLDLHLPDQGAEMQLSFDLPGAPAPFSPTGEVVWRRLATPENGGPGVGLRFLSLDGGASRDLEHFVHEHLGPRFHDSAEGA
jgi:hypothetical protein